MATSEQPAQARTIHEVVAQLNRYPIEAFEFVQHGLGFAVSRAHGPAAKAKYAAGENLHINGRQLCEGLRDLALAQWGYLAGAVLRRWGLTSTTDFGRIVFALVENGLMAKTERDTIDDFKDVFDFTQAFETGYTIRWKQ